MKKPASLRALITLVCNLNPALGLLAALAFGPPPAQAAVTEAWVHRYSNVVSNANDRALTVVSDAAGDIIVTGVTDNRIQGQDMLTIKYSGANGTVLWQQRYNGSANRGDYATAMAVDGNGNVVVTGYSNNGTNNDYYTAKYAATNGDLLWEQRYNGPGNSNDQPRAVAVDGNGNVVVTGSSDNGDSNYADYYTAKYAAADGAFLWERRYNGPANSGDYATALAVDSAGNVVVAGTSVGTSFYEEYYTAKYAAADGSLLWEKRYIGTANQDAFPQAVAVDESGNVVVTGYSVIRDFVDEFSYRIHDYYTAKYAATDGALLWEKRYNGSANDNDVALALALDSSGNVVVTGSSNNRGGLFAYVDHDFYTAKYAATDGTLLWEKRYVGPATPSYSAAHAVALDGNGNVVVTGYSYSTNDNLDYYTAKYSATDGALLWEKRYNGPANRYDRANAAAVDPGGNVVVTGVSDIRFNNQGSFGEGDYYTVKYAAADGELLWEKRYNGPANDLDEARAVAVDGSGNVIVTGYSNNGTNSYSDYYTAKYATANGTLLWEKRYNGPANGYDYANAVAVDSSGNVVVTGYSNNGTNDDYYTAKYAAANGTLLWEKRYNGPANGYDYANAVAVDSNGNVVVSGYSWGGASSFDYYTAKYAAADGALLWEQRYNGPANGADVVENYLQPAPHSLALGPNGMVAITGSSSGDYATVVYRENLPPISIDLVPTGVRLRFTGIPGRSYNIERAPAVTGPWTNINTQTAPASGLIEYLGINPPVGAAFYRTAQP